jgi:ankyrin repeat protein
LDDNTSDAAVVPIEVRELPQPMAPQTKVKVGGQQLENAIKSQNEIAALQMLAAYGGQLDVDFCESSQGLPVTSHAILQGMDTLAMALVQRGADIYLMSRDQGRSVLYTAIESGRKKIVEFLFNIEDTIRNQLDVNKPVARNGETPLHVAVRYYTSIL